MARILVLGGSGFIGSNIVAALLDKNHIVVNFDRPGTSPVQFEKFPNYKFIPGSLADSSHVRIVFDQQPFDKVIYLVSTLLPSSGYLEFIQERDINIIALFEVLRNMESNGCTDLLFFSSGGTVYGLNGKSENKEEDPCLPFTYYGYTKWALEEYIRFLSRTTPVKFTIVRPSNPYGSGQNLFGKQGLIAVALGRVLAGKPIEIWGDGLVVRDYLYIDDLVSAVCLLLNVPANNQTYNIGSGLGASVNQIIDVLKEVVGTPVVVQYSPARKIDVPVNILNIDKIKSTISWEPKISLTDGISSLWTEMKANSKL